jgi:hypothetical protein
MSKEEEGHLVDKDRQNWKKYYVPLSYKSTTLEEAPPAVARMRKQSLPHRIPKHKHPFSNNTSYNRNQQSLTQQSNTTLNNLLLLPPAKMATVPTDVAERAPRA